MVHSWEIRQLDISNAFLHRFLDTDLSMEQPNEFVNPKFSDYVCKLKRILYGLKQVPRAWFQRLSDFLLSIGFKPSLAEHFLFILNLVTLKIYVLIYVDDILVTCFHSSKMQWFLDKIHHAFPIRDLGALNYFLGIKVK